MVVFISSNTFPDQSKHIDNTFCSQQDTHSHNNGTSLYHVGATLTAP